MIKLLTSLLVLIVSSISLAQNPRTVANLPNFIKETSGLIAITNNEFWTHNDSGDGPILYKLDSNGNLLDSIYLSGVTAIDFEDITRDVHGNFYIGDIGNNSHNRTNLVVYKIPNPDSIVGNSVTPEAIHYSYQDQTQFPDPNQNVDCEALFHYQGKLYLISKNWGSSGYSKLYQLPDTAGTFTAMLLDSFSSGLVTSADILPNGKLCVLEMGRIHIFDQFIGVDFFGGMHATKGFILSQKEGVSFLDSTTLYLTQEYHSFFGGAKLMELELINFVGNIEISQKLEASAYPNPAKEYLEVKINSPLKTNSSLKIKLIDSSGKTVSSFKVNQQEHIIIPVNTLEPGSYYIDISTKRQRIIKPFIKL